VAGRRAPAATASTVRMMDLAAIKVMHQDGASIVMIRGEIDLSNTDTIRTDVIDALTSDGPGLVVDLSETTYIDSSGVRLLFDLAERLHARRQRLALVVNEAALVRRVLVLTKLDDAVPLHANLDEALASLVAR
jgi:anti-anti-sigma factor